MLTLMGLDMALLNFRVVGMLVIYLTPGGGAAPDYTDVAPRWFTDFATETSRMVVTSNARRVPA
jgi:hypothetical protein